MRGVDYSHYQCPPSTAHMPRAHEMAEDGIEFVIIKAWEADHPDPNFEENLADALAAGMPAMAYVFLHATDDAGRMRACFEHIGTTVLCLDWEAEGVPDSGGQRWMDAYEA